MPKKSPPHHTHTHGHKSRSGDASPQEQVRRATRKCKGFAARVRVEEEAERAGLRVARGVEARLAVQGRRRARATAAGCGDPVTAVVVQLIPIEPATLYFGWRDILWSRQLCLDVRVQAD